MRSIITIVIAVVAVIVFNTFFANLPYHNSVLYGIFAIAVLLRFYKNIHSNYLIQKRVTHTGEIVALEKKDKSEVAEINYIVDVKFISPYDNKEYLIKSHLNVKPADNIAYVNVNRKKPFKSTLIEKSNSTENAILMAAGIIFCYLVIKNL